MKHWVYKLGFRETLKIKSDVLQPIKSKISLKNE